MAQIHYQPNCIANSTPAVGQLEQVLSGHFGRHAILTSSGRAGIVLALTALGLSRYRHAVAIPRMISNCVVEAVSQRAFPVAIESSQPRDLSLRYHQYGLPQARPTNGPAIEDNCHAMFGAWRRAWPPGDISVFSLPKFFATGGMCGGLLVADDGLATELRRLVVAAPRLSDSERARMSAIFRAVHADGASVNVAEIESVYGALTQAAAPRDADLAGCPETISGWEATVEARAQSTQALLDVVPDACRPPEWSALINDALPFAFPVFADDEVALSRLATSLNAAGVEASVYSIDVARDWTAPDFRRALLIPCHMALPEYAMEALRAFGGANKFTF